MAEERAPAPAPPRPTDLGETPPAPPEAAADAGEPAPVPEEVSALLAASETRVTKYFALRFAELGEALSALAKAVAALGERPDSSPEPAPPKDDGKEAAADLKKQVRAFAADFHRWRELQRNDNRRLFVGGSAVAAICLLLLGLFLQAQTGILPRHDPTNGWKDHVWKKYGAEIVDCELKFRADMPRKRCGVTSKVP